MSGAEVIGLISGIIAIVGATVKIYAAATDVSGLPEAFRDVANRLPLVQETLQTAQSQLNAENPDEALCNAMKPILEDCADKAKQLTEIFEKVVPQADASRMERYLLAARTLVKGDTVESLMKGILVDVQLLTGNRVAKLPTQSDIADLIRVAIEEVSAIPPSLPGHESSIGSDTKRNALIKNLRWTDPTLDKDRIERTKGGLYADSTRWILDHPSYRQWRHDDTKLLWIKGGAGKGKTMLLLAITKELRSYTKLARPGAESCLSFFFCQNTDDRLNNAVAILKGLIYLLLVQDSSLVSYLKDHYDRMGKEVFEVANNVNAFDALSNVFRQMIEHSRSEAIYLAVDALDECEDGLPGLLDLIRETSLQEDRVKWIVTSRNHVNVDVCLALSLEVNSAAVLRAIEVYIEHKVSQVPSLKSNPTQRANVQQKLFDKADGTFLWVDLVLQSMRDALSEDIIKLIDEIPNGLPPLYNAMMRNMGRSASAYQSSCLATLSIVTLTYRPLHILELRMLAGLEQYGTADLEKIVDMCGSFLTLLDNHIYPIHQSAKDYLVSEAALDKIFPAGTHTVHRHIVDKSVEEMTKVLRRDIYELVHPGTLVQQVAVPLKDPLLGVGYSCAYWIDHVCEADQSNFKSNQRSRLLKTLKQHFAPSKKSSRIHDLFATFFQQHFLHWLEALSLLGVVTNGILSLTRLRNIMTIKDNKIVKLIEDAYRFILYNRSIIEQAPLQTYISALLFTPVNSIIRILFAAEEPSWVTTKPLGEEYGNLCLQIFEGHVGSVQSVALSQDGSRIVSGSVDKTVRIWDTKSGKEVQKLHHGEFVTAVALSQDGSHIVSGTDDGSVLIWDVESGKEVRKLLHDASVSSIAFSQDSSRIVSGSADQTVRIWDTKSGKQIQKLLCGDMVRSVILSRDGSRIVVGVWDGAIQIWDTKSGKEVQKLSHGNSVTAVAFSQDNSRIISAADDMSIRIWDAKSGMELRKLFYNSFIYSMAFSLDGSRIISGAEDGTIRIWETKTGKEVRKLVHGSTVNSIALSRDNSRIISGTGDRTVRLWDANSSKEQQELEGHRGLVNSIIFSPDGSLIASGADDSTVRIWDAKSGNQVRKFERPGEWVKSVAFSQDGSRIVSGAGDGTIRIWDITTGKEVHKLEGHQNWVVSVAFSQDGSCIVSGSDDNTVRIWDAKSGKEIQNLGGVARGVRSVAFSQDGNHIVLASSNRPPQIWDIKLGNELRDFDNYRDSTLSVAVVQDSSLILESSTTTSLRTQPSNQLPSAKRSGPKGPKPQWRLKHDGSWITWCGRGTIWVPRDFRPGKSAVSRDGSAVAIGCPTGRVVILRMSLDMPFV